MQCIRLCGSCCNLCTSCTSCIRSYLTIVCTKVANIKNYTSKAWLHISLGLLLFFFWCWRCWQHQLQHLVLVSQLVCSFEFCDHCSFHWINHFTSQITGWIINKILWVEWYTIKYQCYQFRCCILSWPNQHYDQNNIWSKIFGVQNHRHFV